MVAVRVMPPALTRNRLANIPAVVLAVNTVDAPVAGETVPLVVSLVLQLNGVFTVLPNTSFGVAEKPCVSLTASVVKAGVRSICVTLPGLTVTLAVFPPTVPSVAEMVALPLALLVKLAVRVPLEVTPPTPLSLLQVTVPVETELPNVSLTCAVYASDPPAVIDALTGAKLICVAAPAFTVTLAVLPPSVPSVAEIVALPLALLVKVAPRVPFGLTLPTPLNLLQVTVPLDTELPNVSLTYAVYASVPPAATDELAGAMPICVAGPALTVTTTVLPPSEPSVAEMVALPLALLVKLAVRVPLEVTLPTPLNLLHDTVPVDTGLPNVSLTCAVYASDPPAVIDALTGAKLICVAAPAFTVTLAVLPPSVPSVAEIVALPLALLVKVAPRVPLEVTPPTPLSLLQVTVPLDTELPNVSLTYAVYASVPPAATDELAGAMPICVAGPALTVTTTVLPPSEPSVAEMVALPLALLVKLAVRVPLEVMPPTPLSLLHDTVPVDTGLPNVSLTCAVYTSDPPAVIDALTGAKLICVAAPAFTVTLAVLPPSVPSVAEIVALPLALLVKVAPRVPLEVTPPTPLSLLQVTVPLDTELPNVSLTYAVYASVPPAATDELAGAMPICVAGPALTVTTTVLPPSEPSVAETVALPLVLLVKVAVRAPLEVTLPTPLNLLQVTAPPDTGLLSESLT